MSFTLAPRHLRDVVLLTAAASLGWWAHGTRPVQAAATPTLLPYQFAELGPGTPLTLYNPETQTIYIYNAATNGARQIPCTSLLHITRPGAPLQREDCPAGSKF